MMLILKPKKWSFGKLSPFSDSGDDSSPTVVTRSINTPAQDTSEVVEDPVEDDLYTPGGGERQGNLTSNREPNERFTAGDSNYDNLPALDGKAVEHCQEARDCYSGTRPPFVSVNRGRSGIRKSVVLATSEGKYPRHPKVVTLVMRSWNKSELYWILDLEKQTIVKGTAGGFSGVTYRSWLGVNRGLSALPVAFSPRGFLKKVQPNDKTGRSSANDVPSSSMKPRKRGVTRARVKKGQTKHTQTNVTSLSNPPAKKEKPENRLGPGLRPSYQVQPLDSSSGKSVEYLTVSRRPFTVNSGDTPRINQSARIVEQCSSQSASSARSRKGQTGNQISFGKDTRRSESEQFDDAGYIDEESSDIPLDAPASRTRSRKRKRAIPESEELDDSHGAAVPPRARFRESRTTDAPSSFNTRLPTTSTSNFEPSKARSSRTSLSLHALTPTCSLPPFKINGTTLFVRLSPSPDYVPLSLRACRTIDTFFASVLDACEIEEINLARIRVSFGWMPGNAMLMKRSQNYAFEWFFKTIDKAPCWEEEEKECKVEVEVITKQSQ
jgi:hypothetical protein